MRQAVTLAFLLLSLVVPFGVFGQEPTPQSTPINVTYEQVNPADGFGYTFKRLREKITLAILSLLPEKKADFYEKLLGARLAELKYVVDKKDVANLQTSSQRYWTTIGQYTEFLIKNNLSSKKEKGRELLRNHLTVVARLKDAFNDTTAEWRFIKHDEDYLKRYIAQLEE